MKLLTSTILFLTVSTNLFSQTPQTLLQKARVIMEKEIKDNADDPWSYRFTSIDSCFDDTKYKKIYSYIGDEYDIWRRRRDWDRDSTDLQIKISDRKKEISEKRDNFSRLVNTMMEYGVDVNNPQYDLSYRKRLLDDYVNSNQRMIDRYKKEYDEKYQKMVQTDSLYNVLLNSTDKPVVVRIWLDYRIKNTSGGYEKRTKVIYYHTKLKKFAWDYYIKNISNGFENSDL